MSTTTTKKWKSTLGPRMAKAFNTAWSAVSWEGKTFVQLYGVVGGHESRSIMTSPFGNARPEVATGLNDVGERYEWTATPENYKRIIAELDTLKRRLEESRPIKDERRTPEQEAERIRESNAHAQDKAIEARAKAAEIDRRVAELRKECPWAEPEGKKSDHARAAANIKRELTRAFPGVEFRVKSDSFSGGDSVDVHWTDGPTSREVDRIIGKYDAGSFDGMVDLYTYDHSAEGEAVSIVLGRAKYVHGHRAESDQTREAIDRLVAETFAEPEDKHWPVFAASSIPAGAVIVGMEETDEHPWHRLAYQLPEKPATVPTSTTTTTGGEIQKHHHTKHGFDFWLVVPSARVDSNTFSTLRSRCESSGGWYSRKWGRCPGGFAFKEEEKAAEFLASL